MTASGAAGRRSVRVYVATTLTGLGRLLGSGSLGPALPAFTASDDLARWWADGAPGRPDDEELEYAAMLQAAAASLALLDADDVADGTAPARRVVLAADVAAVAAAGGGGPDEAAPGAVALPDELALDAVVSVHVDTADADDAVRAAVAALADDAAPASHVELVLAAVVDHELAWYAPGEAAGLLP